MSSLRFCSNTLDRSFIGIDRKGEDALLKLASIESTRWLLVYDSSKILCEKKDTQMKLAELSLKTLLRALGENKNRNIKDFIEHDNYNISVLGFKTELNEKICYICIGVVPKSEMEKGEDAIIRRIDENSENDDDNDVKPSSLQFQGQRGLVLSLSKEDSSIAGQAISMIHFHKTNAFAGINAERTKSVELGTKRSFLKDKKLYPRLDPVAIALIINSDGTKCLLGRMKGTPQGFFSCLSGFIEQCESVQNAVRREVYEEAGIQVGEVILYDSQPWPLGRGGSCELMIGCIGVALTEEINITETDAVEEICWFDRAEISRMLDKSKLPIQANVKEQSRFIPGEYAIANHLIKAFIDNNFDQSGCLFTSSMNSTSIAPPSSANTPIRAKTPIRSPSGLEEVVTSGRSQALIDKKTMETKNIRSILTLVKTLTLTTSMAVAGLYLKRKKNW
jgi:NAD+ diphosphatase